MYGKSLFRKNPVETQSIQANNALRFKTESVAIATLFCLLCFVLLAPLSTVHLSDGDVELTGEGNVFRQVFYGAAFGLALLCSRASTVSDRLRMVPVSILVALTWCAVSMIWAVDPSIAIRRFSLTAVIIFTVFPLVDKVGYEKTIVTLRIALVLMLAANLVAVLGWPISSIHQASEADPSIVGAWHGILPQKNFAGTVCAFAIMFFVFDAKRIGYLVRLAVIGAAAYFLYRSESKTSMILLLASLGIGGISFKYNPYNRPFLLLFLAVVASAAAIVSYEYWNVIAAPFDNEDTLTGRVQIWPLLLEYWHDHWLTGSGFGSFWNIGGTQPISAYTDGWVTEITSGHNGYIDLLVQIGLPGLTLVMFAAVLAPMWRFVSEKALDPTRRSLLVAVFCFTVGHNLTESSLFDRDATVHVFLILSIALLKVLATSATDGAASDE
jgi:O-antigen ligase